MRKKTVGTGFKHHPCLLNVISSVVIGISLLRSLLIQAMSIKLRKVENVEEQRRAQAQPPHPVASILARRVAIEVDPYSDSESGSDWD